MASFPGSDVNPLLLNGAICLGKGVGAAASGGVVGALWGLGEAWGHGLSGAAWLAPFGLLQRKHIK
jgi:hypothetical protein